ncbi:hypothetical protein ACKGJO_14545 [Gracilimonas sp. Q87]|uniref:hypothetical protein n=1 Tax=Gracilimonas sp. Q87 TaxID=3384766 RepID=UPI0039843FA2
MERETKLLIGGIAVAALGFFIPLYFGKIWLGLFIAFIIGVIFLGRVLSLSEKEFESKVAYRIFYGLVVLVVLFHAIAFAHDYGRKDYQKDLLLEIRKTIDSGGTQADVREKLIYVLGQYHQNDRESIVATFKDVMNEQIGEDGIYLSDFDLRKAAGDSSMSDIDEDNLNHFYEIDEEADEIRVIVVADVSLGSDPDYKNYDGQIGRHEMMFILNKEGVSYEVLN